MAQKKITVPLKKALVDLERFPSFPVSLTMPASSKSNQCNITVLSLIELTFPVGLVWIQDEKKLASTKTKKGKIILFIIIFNGDV